MSLSLKLGGGQWCHRLDPELLDGKTDGPDGVGVVDNGEHQWNCVTLKVVWLVTTIGPRGEWERDCHCHNLGCGLSVAGGLSTN